MAEKIYKWYALRAISGKENKVKEYIEAVVNNHAGIEVTPEMVDNGQVSEEILIASNVSRVLIPTEIVYQIKDGKRVKKEHPTLPGYVLVEVALAEVVDCEFLDSPAEKGRKTRKPKNIEGEMGAETLADEQSLEQKRVRKSLKYVLSKDVAASLRNVPNVLGFLCASPKDLNPMPLRASEVARILGNQDDQLAGEDFGDVVFTVGEQVKVISGPFNGFSGIIEEVNTERHKLKVMVKIFERKTPLELSFMQVEKE